VGILGYRGTAERVGVGASGRTGEARVLGGALALLAQRGRARARGARLRRRTSYPAGNSGPHGIRRAQRGEALGVPLLSPIGAISRSFGLQAAQTAGVAPNAAVKAATMAKRQQLALATKTVKEWVAVDAYRAASGPP